LSVDKIATERNRQRINKDSSILKSSTHSL